MKILDEYLKLQKEIYNYFGFKENYTVLSIEDRRDYFWSIIDDEEVIFGDKDDVMLENASCFLDEIYKQRFYDKWVYRGEEYTMIMVDTYVDGNKFLAIFDNSKEVK